MPNKNYKNGAEKERRICKSMKEKFGYDIAQRTAGSHSPFDVIAINLSSRQIKLIQSKPKSLSEKQKQKIIDENLRVNGWFTVEFKVM